MGMRGPASKPTKLKLLEGNPGKRPPPPDEPKPQPAIPKCPTDLLPLARREWKRIAKELYVLGLLAEMDRAMLAVYCQNWALFIDAERTLKEKGRTYKHPITGEWKTRPEDGVSYRAQRQIMALSYHFGLSAGARTRLQGIKEAQVDDLDAMIGERFG